MVLFEGRDSAGKGGAIKRITQRLNPRVCRVVALPAPTERERTQWYFQRYVPHLPAGGEIVLFDRSWYNRAGVERVMGFADEDQVEEFFRDVPEFERMLVRSGIKLVKYWFSITDQEQQLRFLMRIHDPMKQWKLSPMDLQSRVRWEGYTKAKEEMLERTNIPEAPWSIVEGNDKKAARLNTVAPSAGAGALPGGAARADRAARPSVQSRLRMQGPARRAVRAESVLSCRTSQRTSPWASARLQGIGEAVDRQGAFLPTPGVARALSRRSGRSSRRIDGSLPERFLALPISDIRSVRRSSSALIHTEGTGIASRRSRTASAERV